ncbi:MAG: hypothetical protein JST59_12470, partial [Actinobacteria bacterium]|nr:hypothetical protein [Actinomycetota bacterium]
MAAEARHDRFHTGQRKRFELTQVGGVDQRRARCVRLRRRRYESSRGSASIAPRTISSGDTFWRSAS